MHSAERSSNKRPSYIEPRKYVFDVTSVGLFVAMDVYLSESRDNISPPVQAPFS